MIQAGRRAVTVALAVGLTLVGCSGGSSGAKRADDGKVVKRGTVSVFDLRPGDCLDPPPDLSGDIATLPVVPCGEPHTQEVFAKVESTDSAYPGPEALASSANGLCLSAMQSELELSADDGYFISYLLPSFDGWNQDKDRSILCVFVFPTLGAVIGSIIEHVEAGLIEPGSPPPVQQAPLDPDATDSTTLPTPTT